MGGQREVIFSSLNLFLTSVELAIGSYIGVSEQALSFHPKMPDPNRELRTENLVTAKVQEKHRLDRVFALDVSLINNIYLLYGLDLENVKIHTGPYAEEITHKTGAEALTMGNDIYFSSGSFAPQTEKGKELLLHELEHVNQFRKGQNLTFREDFEKSELEALNQEGLSGSHFDDIDLFERFKQNDLIFKNTDLNDGLDAVEQDLEMYTTSNDPVIYRYNSLSGRTHELTKEEYQSCLKEILSRLKEKFEDEIRYSGEDQRNATINNLVKLFDGRIL